MKTNEIIRSVHWQELFASTLLHSLWIGAVIVLSMWVLRLYYKNRPKELYFISLAALLAIVLSSILTFLVLFFNPGIRFDLFGSFLANIDSFNLYQYINQIWFAGSLIFCFRFFWSHLYIKRLIKASDPLKSLKWEAAFHKVLNHFNAPKEFILLQSDKIGSAFLTGVIKPVILIPTSWINQLSVKEAECILAHELSHALNKDHWVNLFMNLVEIFFFFNPAVHIILSHLKLERELVADASASGYINSRMEYAKLILKIEESSGLIPAFSLPFFRQKKQLRKRIETVLNISGTKTEVYSGFTLMLILSVLAFVRIQPLAPEQLFCLNSKDEKMECASSLLQNAVIEKPAQHQTRLTAQKTKIQKQPINKRKYKYEQVNLIQEVAYEELSQDNFYPIAEKTFRKEFSTKSSKTIQLIEKKGTETIHATDGSAWIVTKQIRCYAPDEEHTIIIVKMNKEGDEPGAFMPESIEPGHIELHQGQIN